MKQTFAIHYRCGPGWLAGKSVFEQPLQAHLVYMRALVANKTLIFGGPFLDDSGGLIVVDVANPQEAAELAQNDPAVQQQIMVAEPHPWKLLAGAW